MDKKQCIFHMPNYIDLSGKSGSSVHPLNMIKGFQDSGYLVECVIGYGDERRNRILDLKNRIKNGEKFEFIFSESSSMPTLLTEKNHLPKYLFLDFGFMKFCHRHGISVGLFYADVQWKFDFYKKNVSWFKRCVSVPLYKYDLYRYSKLVDVFYLPSKTMGRYLSKHKKLIERMKILKPGCNINEEFVNKKRLFYQSRREDKLEIFYVGGVSRIYDLTVFLQAVQAYANIYVTICCRKNEWADASLNYKKYMTPRVNIIHESGEALEKYYETADICCAYAGTGAYMSMAMPVKVFEYMGHAIPILAAHGTEAGGFVEHSEIGFSIENSKQQLCQCLEKILSNRDILKKKHDNLLFVMKENTWQCRAEQIKNDLG